MQRHGRKPMSMTHGDFDYDYLRALALDADGRPRFRLLRIAGALRLADARPPRRSRGRAREAELARRAAPLRGDVRAPARPSTASRFDLAHNMTVTPANLGEVARSSARCVGAALRDGLLPARRARRQPAALAGGLPRARTSTTCGRRSSAGAAARLPWAHLQMGDPRCNRSAYGVRRRRALVRRCSTTATRATCACATASSTRSAAWTSSARRGALALALARVLARRPSAAGAPAPGWALRFVRRVGPAAPADRPPARVDVRRARVHGRRRRAPRLGGDASAASRGRPRRSAPRRSACRPAPTRWPIPSEDRLVPACVQHSVLDPQENLALRSDPPRPLMSRSYDLVVLGGGTAGLVSALIAAGRRRPRRARRARPDRRRLPVDGLRAEQEPDRRRRASRIGCATPTGSASPRSEPEIDFARRDGPRAARDRHDRAARLARSACAPRASR